MSTSASGVPVPSVQREGVQWRGILREYAARTTIHGLRQVVDSGRSSLRRVLWVFLLLIGVGVFFYQVVDRFLYFQSLPVTVNLKVNYNRSIRFPAVTVCNQNNFRLSQAAQRGWFHWLEDMFSAPHLATFNYTGYDVGNISMEDVYRKTAHSMEDMLVRCHWEGEECLQSDLRTTMTDHGVCITFNWRFGTSHSALELAETGAEHALKLMLNVETYEYMQGPHDSAGLKILLHDQNEIPFVRDLGQAIPAGSHAFVGISIVEVSNLPEPHGDCVREMTLEHYDIFSHTACQSDTQTTAVVDKCQCRDLNMPSNETGYPDVCTIGEYIDCLLPAIEELHDHSRHGDSCPIPCRSTHYNGRITYATALNKNIQTTLTADDKANLSAKFIAAHETAQRVRSDIVERDEALIKDAKFLRDDMTAAVNLIMAAVRTWRKYAYNLSKTTADRAAFHRRKGLENVAQSVQQSFVRGWDVIDEQTLAHVTTGYHQSAVMFRQMLDVSLGNETNEMTKTTWHVTTERDLLSRRDLMQRSIDNLTTVHEALMNGTAVYTIQQTPDERYDSAFVTRKFIQHDIDNQTNLFGMWIGYMKELLVEIEALLLVSRTVRRTGAHNASDTDLHLERFELRSRSHNAYRFRYLNEIVLRSSALADDYVDQFEVLQREFASSNRSFFVELDDIELAVAEFFQDVWSPVSVAVDASVEYLHDVRHRKVDLARLVTNDEVTEALGVYHGFFTNLRLLTKNLFDEWSTFKISTMTIMTDMITDDTTARFYSMLHDDVMTVATNDTQAEYLVGILAELLELEVESVGNMTEKQLSATLNADFPLLRMQDYKLNISSDLDAVRGQFEFMLDTGDLAERLHEALEHLSEEMAIYLNGLQLNDDFYHSNFIELSVFLTALSYEEIEQQEAYSFIGLLSDIGGSLGLCLGASLITVAEMIDAVIVPLLASESTAKKAMSP